MGPFFVVCNYHARVFSVLLSCFVVIAQVRNVGGLCWILISLTPILVLIGFVVVACVRNMVRLISHMDPLCYFGRDGRRCVILVAMLIILVGWLQFGLSAPNCGPHWLYCGPQWFHCSPNWFHCGPQWSHCGCIRLFCVMVGRILVLHISLLKLLIC